MDSLTTLTDTKPVTVTHEMLVEAMRKIRDSQREKGEVWIPNNLVKYLKPHFKSESLRGVRFISASS